MDSILGPTPASRDDALKKLPAELVALLMENGFASDISPSSCPELPPELMNMVREHFGASLNSLPMTAEEAKKHRDKLMEERGAFHQTAENGWQQHSYSFCEH